MTMPSEAILGAARWTAYLLDGGHYVFLLLLAALAVRFLYEAIVERRP